MRITEIVDENTGLRNEWGHMRSYVYDIFYAADDTCGNNCQCREKEWTMVECFPDGPVHFSLQFVKIDGLVDICDLVRLHIIKK
jgi:hypothetical protein